MKRFPTVLLSVLLMSTAAEAAEPIAVPSIASARYKQFEQEVAAFGRPLAAPVVQGATTLFVGSSSIRLWDVAASFPSRRAINRGFGGATTADILHYYPRLIADTAPAAIIVYVGENDIAEGVGPDRVAANILTLLGQLRRDMPKARIAYLSMKPTPSRWALYPRMEAVNAEISARAKSGGHFDFLDVGSALLGAEGRPSDEYFGADRLHMSARGYARWNAMIDAYLAGDVPRQHLGQLPQGAS